jgi:type I restriction enzyme S subunit
MQLRLLAKRISETSTNNLPLIRPEDIESRTGSLVHGDYSLLGLVDGDSSFTLAQKNDILICQLRPYLGKVLLAAQTVHASSELIVLRARSGIEPAWLHLVMLSEQMTTYATRYSEGSKMPRTSWEKLANFEIHCVPSAQEQREFISAIQEKLEGIKMAMQMVRRLEDSIVVARSQLLESSFNGTLRKVNSDD